MNSYENEIMDMLNGETPKHKYEFLKKIKQFYEYKNEQHVNDQKTYGLKNDNCCKNPDNWIIDNVSFCGVCKQNI